MPNSKTIRPGMEASSDLVLFVKDSEGNTLGKIKVPSGNKVPPTRAKEAESYSKKK